jgi:hypothetical protein
VQEAELDRLRAEQQEPVLLPAELPDLALE